MNSRPEATPEGALITSALERTSLSQRRAAERAQISEGRWRQITRGRQSAGGGQIPVRGPAETIARMAKVVDVTPDELRAAGRDDAADALEDLLAQPEVEGTGALSGEAPLVEGEVLTWRPDERSGGIVYSLSIHEQGVLPTAVFAPTDPLEWVVSELRRLGELALLSGIGHRPPDRQK